MVNSKVPQHLTIRDLKSHEEFAAFESLQKEVWGNAISEVVSASMAAIVQKIGGVAAGAFDETGRMIGFVFGFTGYRDGILVHWSHMLAVREQFRNSGIGVGLKYYQREQLLKIGVDEVYWTFDPLVARNAHLNFNHLGVSASEYVVDMYGPGEDSILFRGLGTDRIIVVWRIAKDYIKSVLEGRLHFDVRPYAQSPLLVGRIHESDPLSSPRVNEDVWVKNVRIEIPPDIHQLRDADAQAAGEWRRLTRDAFRKSWDGGYEITGFYRDAENGRCFYCLLRKKEE